MPFVECYIVTEDAGPHVIEYQGLGSLTGEMSQETF